MARGRWAAGAWTPPPWSPPPAGVGAGGAPGGPAPTMTRSAIVQFADQRAESLHVLERVVERSRSDPDDVRRTQIDQGSSLFQLGQHARLAEPHRQHRAALRRREDLGAALPQQQLEVCRQAIAFTAQR